MLFYCHYATPTLLRVEKKKEKKEVKMMDCTQLDSKSARRSLHDGNDVMIKQRLFFLQKKKRRRRRRRHSSRTGECAARDTRPPPPPQKLTFY